MGLFEKVFSSIRGKKAGKSKFKTKEEKTQEIYRLVAARTKLEKEIDIEEERIVFEYGLVSDADFDEFVSSGDLKEKEPRYYDLVQSHKNLIKETIELERENFNLKKGVYLGIAVNLETINLSVPRELLYIPWSNWENHAEILGTTRYGKTYILSLIALQMILKGWDIVLMDPKGGKKQELLSWMIEFALESGREEDVLFSNPAYIKQSSPLNPLYGMSNAEIASVVSLLSEGGESDDPFFKRITYMVALGITTSLDFLQNVFDPNGNIAKELEDIEARKYFDKMELNGFKLHKYDNETKVAFPDATERMFGQSDGEYKNILDAKYEHNRSLITFVELAHYSNYENLQALYEYVIKTPIPSRDLYPPEQHNKIVGLKNEAKRLLSQIVVLGDFYSKIGMSLVSILASLATGPIGELFCNVRINPMLNRLTRKDKGLIAIIQPAPLKYQFVAEMVSKVYVKMFESFFGTVSVSGRGSERRIALIIDESKIAHFRGFEELYNKAGGMGMTIVTLMQSEQDRVLKVGEITAKIISDNINIKIALKINNLESKESIVGDFGTRQVHKKVIMGTESGARTTVMTETQQLIDTNAIDKLQKGQAFVSFYGKKYLVKFPFIPPPEGEIIMPKLEEEFFFSNVAAKEMELERAYLDAQIAQAEAPQDVDQMFGGVL